ncbi:hypothetical protein ABZ208_35525 [Streptomyces sp. NPDC006208]|uniref:hypothetical protein n=1 Tax=Streptomyces sp. NPDC006208 TaxID=3156734 RepID=UPI0033A0EDAA
MTHRSPSPAEVRAIRAGNAALLNSRDASVDIVATIVFALGAAGLLADVAATSREDTYTSPLHHNYRVPHDLQLPPEVAP